MNLIFLVGFLVPVRLADKVSSPHDKINSYLKRTDRLSVVNDNLVY